MQITTTPIKDLLVLQPKIWSDHRGYFYESFSQQAFINAGVEVNFVQDNQSCSQKGILRGMHAQAQPFAQGKLVRVVQGSVYDVAIDIRKDSETYGQYFGIKLSAENHTQLWVPPGFLHGFLTLEDQTIFTYKVTKLYDKNSEIGIRYDDPAVNINWTDYLDAKDFILSEKDEVLPFLKDLKSPF